jgi:hypothetical protein
LAWRPDRPVALRECNWTWGLAAIAASPHLGRLASLSLSCYGFHATDFVGAEGVQALTSSSLLARLTILRLMNCGVGGEACEVLASIDLAGLKTLDLGSNSISEGMKDRLKAKLGDRTRS